MPTSTTNYGLIKPGTDDPILIEQLNDNADTIDAALKENADAIENKPDAADIPSPSTAAPAMDGTASPGTSEEYARADHVHPSDTSRASATSEAEDRAALVEIVDSGAKNIADGRRTDTTTGGVEFTFATDGTFTANGTAADHKATSAIMIPICNFTPKTGVKYVLSGCPTNGSPTTYALRVATANDESIAWDTGTGVSFTAASNNALTIKCSIKSGTVVNNMRFAPMICTKAAWDISHAYQPYRPSYQELYDMVKALQPAT